MSNSELIAALRAPSFQQDSEWYEGNTTFATKPRKLLHAAADALEAAETEAVAREDALRDRALERTVRAQQAEADRDAWKAAALGAKSCEEEMLHLLKRLTEIVFEIPPPNEYTPRLVMAIQAVEHHIRMRMASASSALAAIEQLERSGAEQREDG